MREQPIRVQVAICFAIVWGILTLTIMGGGFGGLGAAVAFWGIPVVAVLGWAFDE